MPLVKFLCNRLYLGDKMKMLRQIFHFYIFLFEFDVSIFQYVTKIALKKFFEVQDFKFKVPQNILNIARNILGTLLDNVAEK